MAQYAAVYFVWQKFSQLSCALRPLDPLDWDVIELELVLESVLALVGALRLSLAFALLLFVGELGRFAGLYRPSLLSVALPFGVAREQALDHDLVVLLLLARLQYGLLFLGLPPVRPSSYVLINALGHAIFQLVGKILACRPLSMVLCEGEQVTNLTHTVPRLHEILHGDSHLCRRQYIADCVGVIATAVSEVGKDAICTVLNRLLVML